MRSAVVCHVADNHPAPQVGPGGDYHRPALVNRTGAGNHPSHPVVLDQDALDGCLPQVEPFLIHHRAQHLFLVLLFIRLGTERPHRGPLAGV